MSDELLCMISPVLGQQLKQQHCHQTVLVEADGFLLSARACRELLSAAGPVKFVTRASSASQWTGPTWSPRDIFGCSRKPAACLQFRPQPRTIRLAVGFVGLRGLYVQRNYKNGPD